ncbi:DUF4190 domain-containing protein [Cellulosimicrobium cellulans]|uniref:DUF4190 domain-containing protein n=1 Tax=Cellulosimicrobium cellulans TaxID=1710 RepID=UPI0018839B05|nr:DUF4190 domain-containing protein [Cellulosimicrobium cellulans]MBE9925915.1 DUF4190 domain-containing protein [Cellulosimicrobium cellulans]
MSQPPTAPQDPYQFDPYRPQDSDPAHQEHGQGQDAWAPQGESRPYGSPDAASGAPGYGGTPEQAPYGFPGPAPYGADPQTPYGQPGYGGPAGDPPQGYAQPYPAAGAQQPYGQPYGDPAQQPYGAPQQPYGSPFGNGYAPYAAPASTTGTMAIVGFVLAILGFLGSWIPFVNIFAAVMGIAGVVLGFVGLSQAKQGRSGKGFSIAAIVLGVVSVLVTILVWVLFVIAANEASSQYEQSLAEIQEDSDRALGESTDEILANDLEVEIGTFEGAADEFGWVESALPVTLTNTSDEPLTFDLDIDAVAADGTVVESDFAYTEELAPGESTTVATFDFIDSENLEAMRTATFEVTRVSAY